MFVILKNINITIVVVGKNIWFRFSFMDRVLLFMSGIVLDLEHELLDTAGRMDDIVAGAPHLNLVLDREVVDVVAPRLTSDPDEVVALTANQQANLVLEPKGHTDIVLEDLGVEFGGRIPTMDGLPHHLPLGHFLIVLPVVAGILLDDLGHDGHD